ncbi:dUTP diphosphatase [Kangiella koreensis]|uniref:dUTPase n=1 Tax=Kangiella koreensis (strain DSM 16069 / JCM 12317 / KCTC 12182 / SW-125) TaxID=523791 RepID=C7R7T4_KANKD|nr:dUTP diphosphatase [Kangiella koreensis]ACV27617.1 dUTPase [Kangiella koreensis DSM 16069]
MPNKETMIRQIAVMLEMQNAMNSKVNEKWFDQNFEWYRAIWIECAEMLEHYGWKWWKHQKPDAEQVKMELVDIFHFGLSSRIDGETSFEAIAEELTNEMLEPTLKDDFKQTLEVMAGQAVMYQHFDGASFAGCMQQMEMPFEELFKSYVGKNTLNFFRQDKGYKEGTYIKEWDGREDNEVLVEILNKLDSSEEDFRHQLYQELADNYPRPDSK